MGRLASSLGELEDHYEVVVIGSGYGGAIAASRLARAGRKVCILERGREFQPGDYPNTELEAMHQLQVDGPLEHAGSRFGLFDVRIGDGISVFVGCGLGGTSLINAGVCLRPDSRVFDDPRWPAELRGVGLEVLEPWIARAEEMLKPHRYPRDLIPVRKQDALHRSAEAMGSEWSLPPIAVGFEDGVNHVGVEQKACILCGDCMTGCNHRAKQTLIMNYLPDAHNHGASIFTQIDVRSVERLQDRWLVHYQLLRAGREKFHAPTMSVSADLVVVAAGSLGSTEILLRSKAAGLSLSDHLGQGFSGNGDVLGFAYNTTDAINGVGYGHRDGDGLQPVGPVITSLIDVRDTPELEDGMVIEEGALSGALKPMLAPIFAVGSRLFGKETMAARGHAIREIPSLLAGVYAGAMNRTQTYLVMAHDSSDGHMSLKDGRLKIHWPNVGAEKIFEKVHSTLVAATDAIGGVYVKNPIWTARLNHELVTVHPIGGAVMAEDAGAGVVDPSCRAFAGAEGSAVHDGLYVIDGSIIPRSLGVNPLLTISGLAERAVARLATERGWTIDYTLPSAPAVPAPSPKLGLEFTETMKGHFSKHESQDFEQGALIGQREGSTFEFTLTIQTDDLEEMLVNSNHRAVAVGTVVAPALSSEPLTVTQGSFELFVPDPDEVGLRRMRYRLTLASDEGGVYWMDGFKLIRDESWTHFWHATTTLYITVHDGDGAGAPVLGRGVLHIQVQDLVRQLTTMQATNATSLEQQMEGQAKFGAYFGGTVFETYGGIFSRPNMFNPDASPRKKRPSRAAPPDIHQLLAEDGAKLRLTRYRGGDKGPVMLVHGIASSSRVFTIDTVDPNLMEFLFAHGYDVWLLDWRGSSELQAGNRAYDADDVARKDIPLAVATVRELAESPDVQVVAHGVGAGAFLMSMAGGLEGVRSATCLQFGTRVVAPHHGLGEHLPSFMHATNVESMSAYVDSPSGWRSNAWDAAFRITHLRDKEGCHSPVCHRLTHMFGIMYHHRNLNGATHGALHELFGPASPEIFRQLQRWERAGMLVDASGKDAYTANLERLAIPIAFIHGADDACILAEGTVATVKELSERNGAGLYELHVVPGYGHVDCLIGKQVLHDIFPLIIDQLEKFAGAGVVRAST